MLEKELSGDMAAGGHGGGGREKPVLERELPGEQKGALRRG